MTTNPQTAQFLRHELGHELLLPETRYSAAIFADQVSADLIRNMLNILNM